MDAVDIMMLMIIDDWWWLMMMYMYKLCTLFVLGKGLTLVGSVMEGDFNSNREKADAARNALKEAMKQEKAKGFADVIVAKDVAEGLSYLWVSHFYTCYVRCHFLPYKIAQLLLLFILHVFATFGACVCIRILAEPVGWLCLQLDCPLSAAEPKSGTLYWNTSSQLPCRSPLEKTFLLQRSLSAYSNIVDLVVASVT